MLIIKSVHLISGQFWTYLTSRQLLVYVTTTVAHRAQDASVWKTLQTYRRYEKHGYGGLPTVSDCYSVYHHSRVVTL